jgi:hypothetical protein
MAQERLKARKRISKKKEYHLFTGLLICADCGRHMAFGSHRTRNYGDAPAYHCPAYSNGVAKGVERRCTSHHTNEIPLIQTVLDHINALIIAYKDAGQLASILRLPCPVKGSKGKPTEEQLRRKEQDVSNMIKRVFEQNARGILDDKTFSALMGTYQEERKQIELQIAALANDMSEADKRAHSEREFSKLISKYTQPLECLTREVLHDLIEKIMVHEPIGKKGSKYKTQEVDIYYRFVGTLSASDIIPKTTAKTEPTYRANVNVPGGRAVIEGLGRENDPLIVYYNDEDLELFSERYDGWSKTNNAILGKVRRKLVKTLKYGVPENETKHIP